MLRRIVTWSYDRRRRVVALWLVAVVAASVLAGAAGGDTDTDYTVPGSDSAAAVELLQERFPRFAGGTVDVVYTAADGGVTDPDTAARIDELAGDIAGVDHVLAADPGPVSPDGSTGMVRVRFDEEAQEVPAESVERVMDLAGEAEGDGLQIELGGYPIEQVEQSEAGSESVGLLAAVVILLVAF